VDFKKSNQMKNKAQITVDGKTVSVGQLLASHTSLECGVELKKGNRILLFGGLAFPEPLHLYWNFASSSKERLEQAKQDWKNRKFPIVPNDDTYIALPS
jgi:redox-sensitive bicupin YhaK (pirin superfamily)